MVKVIQRVTDVRPHPTKRGAHVVGLACGHIYEFAEGYHAPNICARWCYLCGRVRDSLLNIGPPREGA